MTLRIVWMDGDVKTWSYVSSVDTHEGVLIVRPDAHSNQVIKFPIVNIRSWEIDK